jgi:hypothetical protein
VDPGDSVIGLQYSFHHLPVRRLEPVTEVCHELGGTQNRAHVYPDVFGWAWPQSGKNVVTKFLAIFNDPMLRLGIVPRCERHINVARYLLNLLSQQGCGEPIDHFLDLLLLFPVATVVARRCVV